MKKNNRAARTACTLFGAIVWRSLPNDDLKMVKFEVLTSTGARSSKFLVLCLLQENYLCQSSERLLRLLEAYLSNHDDNGNKNVTNLHIWRWKTIVLQALHEHFSFFGRFVDVLVLSTKWNDLFCSCVDDVSIWWQMFNFVFLSLKRWFQFDSRTFRTHFASVMTLNNWETIAEIRSYIFRRRSRCRPHRLFYSWPTWKNCKALNLTKSSILMRRFRCSCRGSFFNSLIFRWSSPCDLRHRCFSSLQAIA